MDNGDNDIKQYTAEDITRYWQGKLSPQEMHAMEMAAMDDPFLADAMEGYSNANAATVDTEIHELQHRLKERTSGATVVPLLKKNKWWSVAALLIFLCGIGALMYSLFLQNNYSAKEATASVIHKDSTAAGPVEKADSSVPAVITQNGFDTLKFMNADTASSSYATISSDRTKPNWSGSASQKPVRESSAYVLPNPEHKSRDSLQAVAKATDQARKADDDAFLKKETQRNDSPAYAQNDASRSRRNAPESLDGRAAGVVQRNVQNNQATVPAARDYDQNNVAFNNFSGRVLDRNNMPIPYATVRTNNAPLTATDQNGYFNIKSYDSVLNLSATSIGFVARNFTMRNNEPVDVVLDHADKKLQEVVVVGYGTQKKKDVTGSATLSVFVMDTEPVVGWSDYNKYIETNRFATVPTQKVFEDYQRRRDTAATGARREVVVVFNVSKTGKLSNFR
ncbi:MAG TPA: carboxypeptidase-like regulatory domain-containing protein, partial [Chitinophagaceae bacterium]